MAFRRLAPVLAVLLVTIAIPNRAQAQNADGCTFDPVTLEVHCGVITPGGGDGPTSDNENSDVSPYRYEVERVGACIEDIGPGNEGDTPYIKYIIRVYDRETNDLVDIQTVCQLETDPPPAPPPPPPTPGQIMEGFDSIGAVRPKLLPPPIGENGSLGGVVQFESWGWCEPPKNAVVDIELGPWRARAEMKIVGHVWDVQGVEPFSMAALSCGTPQTPESDGAGAPFKWTGHKAGEYTVRLTTAWTGTAQYWLNGELMGTVDLGSYQYSSSVQQTLREIEAVNG